MSEQRSMVSAVALVVCLLWAGAVWLVPEPPAAALAPSLLWHRVASVVLATGLAIYLFLAVTFERTD